MPIYRCCAVTEARAQDGVSVFRVVVSDALDGAAEGIHGVVYMDWDDLLGKPSIPEPGAP
jgi:hypothetical protein